MTFYGFPYFSKRKKKTQTGIPLHEACVMIKHTVSRANCLFLAHLSRRLIGELLVYRGIRRPSVRPSSTFSNDFSSEVVRPILFIFHI